MISCNIILIVHISCECIIWNYLTRVVFNNNNIPVASDISIETLTCAKAIQELLDVRDRIK